MGSLLTLFFSLLLLASCGNLSQKFGRLPGAGTTSVTVGGRHFGLSPLTALNGGIMIYAVNTADNNKRGAMHLSNESQQAVWTIPNGTYRFFSFGYDASLTSGDVHCADGGTHSLSGVAKVVSLNFTRAACSNYNLFQTTGSDSGTNGQPRTVLVVPCGDTGGTLTSLNSTPYNTCSSQSIPASNGSVSHNISIPSYDNFDGNLTVLTNGTGIQSACFAVSAGAHNNNGIKLLPGPAGGSSPFVYGLNLYSSASCVGNRALLGFGRGLTDLSLSSMRFLYRPSGGQDYVASPPSNPMAHIDMSNGYIWAFIREHSL